MEILLNYQPWKWDAETPLFYFLSVSRTEFVCNLLFKRKVLEKENKQRDFEEKKNLEKSKN